MLDLVIWVLLFKKSWNPTKSKSRAKPTKLNLSETSAVTTSLLIVSTLVRLSPSSREATTKRWKKANFTLLKPSALLVKVWSTKTENAVITWRISKSDPSPWSMLALKSYWDISTKFIPLFLSAEDGWTDLVKLGKITWRKFVINEFLH